MVDFASGKRDSEGRSWANPKRELPCFRHSHAASPNVAFPEIYVC
jgi:hypothetical protein